jgi:hypothetical protein
MLIDEFARTIKGASSCAVENFVECADEYIQEQEGRNTLCDNLWSDEYSDWWKTLYNSGEDPDQHHDATEMAALKYDMPEKKWRSYWVPYYKKYFLDEGEL